MERRRFLFDYRWNEVLGDYEGEEVLAEVPDNPYTELFREVTGLKYGDYTGRCFSGRDLRPIVALWAGSPANMEDLQGHDPLHGIAGD